MNKEGRVTSALLIGAVAGIFLAGAAAAQTASYEGKTLRMIIPSGAGGGYDTYARVLVGASGKASPRQADHHQPEHARRERHDRDQLGGERRRAEGRHRDRRDL